MLYQKKYKTNYLLVLIYWKLSVTNWDDLMSIQLMVRDIAT